jgi:hypothetical protein
MAEERSIVNTFMIILAVLLIFVGPTYMVYAFSNMMGLSYFLAVAGGFTLFMLGLVLLLILVKKKAIS